jgi:hypothetical protein
MPYKDPERRRTHAAAYDAAHREERRAYAAAHREENRAYNAAYKERQWQAAQAEAAGCIVGTWEENGRPGWQGRLAREVARRRIAEGEEDMSLADLFEPARQSEFYWRQASGWL